MRIRFSAFVRSDLAEIAAYIAEDSPRHAIRFVHRLRKNMEELSETPKLYRLRPEIGKDARVLPVGNYVILYRVLEDVVRIERVVHGGRDLLTLLEGAR